MHRSVQEAFHDPHSRPHHAPHRHRGRDCRVLHRVPLVKAWRRRAARFFCGDNGAAVDVDDARHAGAVIGETVGEAANQAQRIASNAALTAKIKSKMALDDTIEAADINVDSSAGVVTLRGSVSSLAEHDRALQLARETDGVTSVVDHLVVK